MGRVELLITMFKFYKNLKIRNKISLSFYLLIILVIAMGVVNFFIATIVVGDFNYIVNSLDSYQSRLWDLQTALSAGTGILEGYDEGYYTLVQAKQAYNSTYQNSVSCIDALKGAVSEGIIRQNELNNQSSLIQLRKNIANKLFGFGNLKNNPDAVKELSQLNASEAVGEDAIVSLRNEINNYKLQKINSVTGLIAYAEVLLILFPVVIILLWQLLYYLLVQTIAKPLDEFREVTQQIGKGDLTKQVGFTARDEIGNLASSFNQMLKNLQQTSSEYYIASKELEKQQVGMTKTEAAMLNILDDVKESEKELSKFKMAIEDTSEHVIMTDPEGLITYANKAAETLTGYTFAEMKGRTPGLWGRQMPPEVYASLWDTIKNKKQSYEGEFTNKRKDGTLYTVSAKISPVLDGTGKILFFVGNERDISAEKKLAEQALKEKDIIAKQVEERTKELSEKNAALSAAKEEIGRGWFQLQSEKARLLASVNSISIGFLMFDNFGQLVIKNPVIEEILGKDKNHEDVESIDKFLGKDFLIKQNFNKCLEEKAPVNKQDIGFNGKFFRMFMAPIFSTDNTLTVIGVVVLIEDVTEQKVTERSRDEFFSIASHELRTPLTAIRGNTSLIEQYYADKIDQDKDLKEMIDDIHASSIRLIQIVNDFLNVSRLEQGRMEYKLENFDLPALIDKKIEEVGSLSLEKNIKVTFEKPKILPPSAYADKDRVGEVLLNLLGNAIKYSDIGTVTVQTLSLPGGIKVSVTDTGKGIPMEQQSLLFRKFQQAGNSILTRDTTRATGLGLYISKMIIEQMGGQISLEKSEQGVGSTFAFTIPVAK